MDAKRTHKQPNEVSIKRTVNGGYIVRHSFDNFGSGESYQPSREHAFGDHKTMMAHVAKTVGGPYHEPMAHGFSGGQKGAPTQAAGKKAAKTHGRGVD